MSSNLSKSPKSSKSKLSKLSKLSMSKASQVSTGKGNEGEDVELDKEASEVESALQRSFGHATAESTRRSKASSGLRALASHWTDGDAKKLVLALANRYGATHKINPKDIKKPSALVIASPRNSRCSTAKFEDLDWDKGWWTDDSFGMHYIHVHHKDGETIHRVYCKHCQQPRIQVLKGKPYWLFSK